MKKDKLYDAMKEYILDTCDKDCFGDSSVGIKPCPFFVYSDYDVENSLAITGGCLIKDLEADESKPTLEL